MSGLRALTMPRWGMTMTEGTLSAWLADEGEAVSEGQEVCEIETSKIANALEAPVGGILRRRVAAPGQVLPVGALLGVIAGPEVPEEAIDAFVAERARAGAEGEAAAAPAPRSVAGLTVLSMGAGEAAPAVLIHGFGGGPDSWAFVQPELAAVRPVHAVALPGHAGSEADVGAGTVAALAARVAAALEVLGGGPFHLVGHSLGGAVALRLAVDRPGLARSLALISPVGFGPEVGAYVAAILSADRRKEAKAALELLLADPALVSRDMVEEALRARRIDGALAAMQAIAAAVFPGGRQAEDLRPAFAALALPRLVIWGAEDRVLPAAQAGGLGATVLPGTGHLPQLERAGEVARALAAHLAAAEG